MAKKERWVKKSEVIEGEILDDGKAFEKFAEDHVGAVRLDKSGEDVTGVTVGTREGTMNVSPGSFVGRDGTGAFVVMSPARLEREYEKV